MVKNILMTGRPGSGKTTLCLRLVDFLKSRGKKVGGVLCPEIRIQGSREGFKIIDMSSGREGVLASVHVEEGPQVSKYRVNMKDLKEIAAGAVLSAIEKCDVVVIDEIGPMESFSGEFLEAVHKALNSEKIVLAVVHWARKEFASELLRRGDSKLFEVTAENRTGLLEEIVSFLEV